jgi:hypothetical protein
MGKPVLAPEGVGMVPELLETDLIRRYPAGDAEALVALVSTCYEEKRRRSHVVQDRTWDAWAQAHHHLFMQLLRSRGQSVPAPALGFRFGMLTEIDISPGVAVHPLEDAVDQAARHLYFGRSDAARAVLEGVCPQYPLVQSLLDTIPCNRNRL